MGSCLSKKSKNSSSSAEILEKPAEQIKSNVAQVVEKKKVEEETLKKEIFIIKHRKSHEIERRVGEEKSEVKKGCEVSEMAKNGSNNNNNNNNDGNSANSGGVLGLGPGSGVLVAAPVRTSSCTKEEVDAILIQCGRLSRSSSTGKVNFSGSTGSGENGNNVQRGRKYSGSKRSYDFDHENGSEGDKRKGNGGEGDAAVDDDNGVAVAAGERSNRHRQSQRQSRTVGSPSKGRRRTPSRERDQAGQQSQPRSGSRERGSNGSGRRVSRSPGRRSESPITTSSGVTNPNSSSATANSSNGNGNCRPGKMVSVPATVSSLAIDKSNNGGGGTETISGAAVKRIQLKRNAGSDAATGTRTAASPRARSPARAISPARANVRASNENQNANSIQNQQQQQPLSLSRSNSRKADQSPFKRNPLGEIDTNIVLEQMPLPGLKATAGIIEKNLINVDCKSKENKNSITEENKNLQAINNSVGVNVVDSGPDILKPHGVTRSRPLRLSRDLDVNPETLSNPSPSYTALLLEDIQNFHQKNNTPAPAFTLPACVSKACSILEAVADLNSSTGSNLSGAYPDDKRRTPMADQFCKLYDNNTSFGVQQSGNKKGLEETKEPFMQSEVVVGDDLMEPSFHKYVTVRRGGTLGGEDIEEQESSGSNSIVGGQQHWGSSSSWEPNSADSTDCWTSSSRSNCREDSRSPVPFQRLATLSEPGNKRESNQQQKSGIGRGRMGSSASN